MEIYIEENGTRTLAGLTLVRTASLSEWFYLYDNSAKMHKKAPLLIKGGGL